MRIGIDLGGTKTEGIIIGPDHSVMQRLRVATPANDYAAQIETICAVIHELESRQGQAGLPVGIGHPGALSPKTGLVKNANSTCLNGRAMKQDIERALKREVRMANDADCLAVSEQFDGAAAGARTVFAVILGTGVGGGLVHDGRLMAGPNAIAGEWGHNPLPWPRADWGEIPGPQHWDGRHGAIESWLSGPGLARDHAQRCGQSLNGEEIVAAALAGAADCEESLARYEDRLARALATVINLLDPDVIVLGGGLCRIQRLYENVPVHWKNWVFSDSVETRLVPAAHGDSSGVRGAAWLWPVS